MTARNTAQDNPEKVAENFVALPKSVEKHYEQLKHMDVGMIARLINKRAGRTATNTPHARTIIQQFNLIESELIEGKLAAAIGDVNGVRDAIADIMLLAAGQMGHISDLDVVADYKRMCAYNMTRIPTTMQEAVNTIAKYRKIGIDAVALDEVTVGGVVLFPVVTENKEQYCNKGEHYPPNKFLKSADFLDVQYNELPEVFIVGGNGVQHLVGAQFSPQHYDLVKSTLEMENLASDAILQVIEKLIGVRA